MRVVSDLRNCGQAFGIVTPHATQRTALKKDRCADTVTVMNGKAFDFKNCSGHTNASA
jgi:hypothetical protein